MIQLRRLVFRDLVPLPSARTQDRADRIAVAGGERLRVVSITISRGVASR